MSEEDRRAEWHLDRRVTIALIAALLAHGAGTVWWASRLTSTVETHSARLAEIDTERREQRRYTGQVDDRLARLEERLAQQTDLLREVRRLLSYPGSAPGGPR